MSYKLQGRTQWEMQELVCAETFTVTLAELNAGKVLIPDDASLTLTVRDYTIVPNGTFAALTDARLSDTSATPNEVVTILAANLGTGTIHRHGVGTNTPGKVNQALGVGKGLQIRKTGSDATGGTDISVTVLFTRDKQ